MSSVILDIEGSPAARAISGRLWWMLSAASASVAIAVLLGLNALPHNQLARFVAATGPSVLEQAFARPVVPRLTLDLPTDIAVPLPPGRIVGDYGPGRPGPTVRSFKLRGSSDIVVIAFAPDARPWARPSSRRGAGTNRGSAPRDRPRRRPPRGATRAHPAPRRSPCA